MQGVHFQVRVGVFNCQQILTKISVVIFDLVIKKTNRMSFSVALVKFHWFGINCHVFMQKLSFVYYYLENRATNRIWKVLPNMVFPRFGRENGGVLSMRMQVILNSLFARPGSAPLWRGKKGEFRDWTTIYIVWKNKSWLENVVMNPSTSFFSNNSISEFCWAPSMRRYL